VDLGDGPRNARSWIANSGQEIDKKSFKEFPEEGIHMILLLKPNDSNAENKVMEKSFAYSKSVLASACALTANALAFYGLPTGNKTNEATGPAS
jgi:hypothetical protein